MTREEARKHLIDWIEFVNNPDKHAFMDEPCSDEEIIEAMRIGADALSQPSLPDNLDDACQRISEECYNGYFSGYEESHRIAARMGAEWMAEQGYTTEETVYFERLCDENRIMVDLGCGEPERGGFNPGDKVIVQIRKKQ